MIPSRSNQENSTILMNKHEVAALRLKFLTPLVAAIVSLVIIFAIGLFYFESGSRSYGLIHARLTRTQFAAKDLYEKTLRNDVNALSAVMAALRRDEKLREEFASYDRKALFEYTETMFKEMKRDYNVTHFYFTKPDRVNLLRVHAPGRHGDRIDRVTTLRAEQNEALEYGVELGALGTFTLRVVSPWHDKQTGRLIGYIELGMEIDHVINRLRDIFGLDVIVVIDKTYLERDAWEDGMSVLERAADWERFEKVVLSAESEPELPLTLRERLERGEHLHQYEVEELDSDGFSYWLLTIPIEDARGREVADMTLLADVSSETDVAERTAWVVGATVLLIGGLLIAFFSWQAGRIGRRIVHNEEELAQLASHDSLTGLYTRRMFHEYLDEELDRSIRFTHPLSLLLVDIDHFKQVNDTYGHQAGDAVLQELSMRLVGEAREIDHVCRYGGEELALILPETNVEGAELFANRLKSIVSALSFDTSDDQTISITISIGVASYPMHAGTNTALISAADSALFDAKEGGRNRVCTYTRNK